MDWGQCFGASDSRLLCSGNAGLWTAIQADVDKDDLQFLLSLKARMLLHNAAQFERRVTGTLRQYPFKLLWLVFTPADEPCGYGSILQRKFLRLRKGTLKSMQGNFSIFSHMNFRLLPNRASFRPNNCIGCCGHLL